MIRFFFFWIVSHSHQITESKQKKTPIQQIDNIFQLSIHTLVIIEVTSKVFKTDGKILFKIEILCQL